MATASNPAFALVALLLVFVLPGFGLARALWPEWRLRGERGLETIVTLAAASLVLSVGISILVGFVLGNAPGGWFQASPSSPVLEAILTGLTGAFLLVALLRGAFSHTVPAPPKLASPPLAGEQDLAEVWQEFEEMARQESELRRRLKAERGQGSPEAAATQRDLETLMARRRERETQREAELGA